MTVDATELSLDKSDLQETKDRTGSLSKVFKYV